MCIDILFNVLYIFYFFIIISILFLHLLRLSYQIWKWLEKRWIFIKYIKVHIKEYYVYERDVYLKELFDHRKLHIFMIMKVKLRLIRKHFNNNQSQ